MKRYLCTTMFIIAALAAQATAAPAPFDDPAARDEAVQAATARSERAKRDAVTWARSVGMPLRYDVDAVTRELMALDSEGRPVYYSTFNVNAAISTAANILRDNVNYALHGLSVTVGVWDGGSVRAIHQEFGGRVQVMDGAASHWHSTHVGGTIAAAGVQSNALGMAPVSRIHSYDWNNDIAELTSRGASATGQGNRLYLSNHSYGIDGGWFWDTTGGAGWHWRFGLGTLQDPLFGQYETGARDIDVVAYGAPYLLMMIAAGNSRKDNPLSGDPIYYWNGSGFSSTTYNPAIHPGGDGVYKSGYDTITANAVAKNCLTVGAVNDAVLLFDGKFVRWPPSGTMSTFSGWGPTDDGRIKPDVVGNGVGLYSAHNATDSAYSTSDGTSMASPNVCGTAALLLEQFRRFGSEPRASTMKALLIHTADDLGTPGPDYRFGWGLVNGVYAADVIAADHGFGGVTHIREGVRSDADGWLDYTYVSAGAAPFKATLCWTDPPGTTTSGHDDRTAKLVHDLDLRVVGPDSTTYYPFRLDYNNPTAAATCSDNACDNVEQVLIDNPAAGTYTVRVRRWGGLIAAQPFSLIVTTEPYPLSAPTGVNASDGLHAFYVNVTWNGVNGATQYRVYRNNVYSANNATLIATVAGTNYSDTSAEVGVTYYYWVKARSTLSESGFSIFNTGFREPVAPIDVVASDGEYLDQVAISWKAMKGATSYKVYRSENFMPGSSTMIGVKAGTNFLDNAVIPGATYYYWVKTVMSGVESYYSAGDSGFALLTLDCPAWKLRQGRRIGVVRGKDTTPALESLFEDGWQIGLAERNGNRATPFAGPFTMTPNKRHTIWRHKTKKTAVINYSTRRHLLRMSVWTNIPPVWVIYSRP